MDPVSAETLASMLATLPPERARAVLCEVVSPVLAPDDLVSGFLADYEVADPVAAVAFAIREATMDPEVVWVGDDATVLRIALEILGRAKGGG